MGVSYGLSRPLPNTSQPTQLKTFEASSVRHEVQQVLGWHATSFTVVPGANDIENPHPNIILGIEDWQKKGYSLSDDAPQLIERSREFMKKLNSGIEELNC